MGHGFVVDAYLLHQVEVGRMPVRTGRAERPASLRVTVEQLEDSRRQRRVGTRPGSGGGRHTSGQRVPPGSARLAS